MFHDGYRQERPDPLFGSPVAQSLGGAFIILPAGDDYGDFSKRVALLGDRSVLNPVSEETADIFFGTLQKLAANTDENTPLTMVVMAHDYYQRPMYFYEMMSRFVKKYQMDEKILKRLNLIICAGHEHSTYSGQKELYLQGTDGRMYGIPCSFGGAGIFLEGINVFAGRPGATSLEEGDEKWITMDARDYTKYDAWLNEKFPDKDELGNPEREDVVAGQPYYLQKNFELTSPEYTMPAVEENNGLWRFVSQRNEVETEEASTEAQPVVTEEVVLQNNENQQDNLQLDNPENQQDNDNQQDNLQEDTEDKGQLDKNPENTVPMQVVSVPYIVTPQNPELPRVEGGLKIEYSQQPQMPDNNGLSMKEPIVQPADPKTPVEDQPADQQSQIFDHEGLPTQEPTGSAKRQEIPVEIQPDQQNALSRFVSKVQAHPVLSLVTAVALCGSFYMLSKNAKLWFKHKTGQQPSNNQMKAKK